MGFLISVREVGEPCVGFADRFAEPEIAEFIWRNSHGVTGNFKRLLHRSYRVAKDTYGRQRVEFSDIYEAAKFFPSYIDR